MKIKSQTRMPDGSSDIANLLLLVADGDREAFAALYHSTSAKLFGIILRILKQRELAEEILQEVYIKIWQNAVDFERGRASPISWMATIARNHSLDEVRRKKTKVSGNDAEMFEVEDQTASPEQQLAMNNELTRLEKCLSQLDNKRSSIVKLAYLDGLSRQELSDHFNQPVGTIKTWLHRSLKQLQECLAS